MRCLILSSDEATVTAEASWSTLDAANRKIRLPC
ncbi:unnamed protein product [Haemonchus placei]|uniref:Uncharacterized protein n=1 Tax=Haemonchus placei TaxID=6290 RepID=A0A3P7UTA5_HAEPC|nr:unnamed protein product [Haemonchus placei]